MAASLHDRDVALAGKAFQPGLEILGDVAQHLPAHWIELPVGIEEADHQLGLLERMERRRQSESPSSPIGPSPGPARSGRARESMSKLVNAGNFC